MLGFVYWTGTHTYYVGTDGTQVIIYNGKPGGVLWIQPSVAETTELPLADVPPADRVAVTAGVEEPSMSAARTYVRNLIEKQQQQTGTSTTTTTAAPRPSTSSTTRG